MDLCPVCRKFTPYQLFRISLAKNLYGRARSEGEPRGYEGMCLECATRIDVDPGDYRGFYETPGNSISNLIRDTFPSIRKARAQRLRMERTLREGTLSPAERRTLLLEPFQLFDEPVRRIYQRPGRIVMLATLLLLTALVAAGMMFLGGRTSGPEGSRWQLIQPYGPILAGAAVALAAAWVMAAYTTAVGRRPFRQDILPSLSKALRPLQPTREEVGECLEEMRRNRAIIGRKVTPAMVWRQLE